MTDNGTSATAGNVTYVGTGGSDTGGDVTVGSDGTVYLTGSTTGTFAGQTRNIPMSPMPLPPPSRPAARSAGQSSSAARTAVSTGAGIAIAPSGSSVLDALGLPQGSISPNQSVDLTQQTTLRAGDSFQIQIEGRGAAHRHHHHRPGRDLQFAGHQDQRPARPDRHRRGELYRQRRGHDHHRQSRQHNQPRRRDRPISTRWGGWASLPA